MEIRLYVHDILLVQRANKIQFHSILFYFLFRLDDICQNDICILKMYNNEKKKSWKEIII